MYCIYILQVTLYKHRPPIVLCPSHAMISLMTLWSIYPYNVAIHYELVIVLWQQVVTGAAQARAGLPATGKEQMKITILEDIA